MFVYLFSCRIRQVNEKFVSKPLTILKTKTTILNHTNIIEKVRIK